MDIQNKRKKETSVAASRARPSAGAGPLSPRRSPVLIGEVWLWGAGPQHMVSVKMKPGRLL